jgi:hypothetical protein
VGQSATPSFATGMEEVASIADEGGHGTRFAVETTGPCPQYPSKPPRGPTGVISALGQQETHALQQKTSWPLPPAREADVAFPPLAASEGCRNPDHCNGQPTCRRRVFITSAYSCAASADPGGHAHDESETSSPKTVSATGGGRCRTAGCVTNSGGRKPIRRGRFASSSAFPRAGAGTSLRA